MLELLFDEINVPVIMLLAVPALSCKVGNYSVDVTMSTHLMVIADFKLIRRGFVFGNELDSGFKRSAPDSAFRKRHLSY